MPVRAFAAAFSAIFSAIASAALLLVAAPDARADSTLPQLIRAAIPQAVTADPDRARDLVVEMRWTDEEAAPAVRNTSAEPIAIREIVLFDIAHGLAPATRMYGEGLQMLAQTAGTIAAPEDQPYGVREFAMTAMMNGLALHGGFAPYLLRCCCWRLG